MTTTIPIHYAGCHVADVDPAGRQLRGHLADRVWHDPEVQFVQTMCAFAQLVLTHHVVPYYDDVLAANVARAALVPAELAERTGFSVPAVSRMLGVPEEELDPAKLAQILPLYLDRDDNTP